MSTIRILTGILFFCSGVSKFLDLPSFRSIAANFDDLPRQLIPAISIVVPSIESLSGLLLILGICIRWASASLATLLASFIAVIIPVLATENQIECGCFGTFMHGQVDSMLIGRDLVLILLTLVLFFCKQHAYTVQDLKSVLRRRNEASEQERKLAPGR